MCYVLHRVRIRFLANNPENGDIGGGYITFDTWFHFGLTWSGPGNHFNTYIDGDNQGTSVTSKALKCVALGVSDSYAVCKK